MSKRKAQNTSYAPRRRMGCLPRLIIFAVLMGGCYWLLFAPIQAGTSILSTGTQPDGPIIDGELTPEQETAFEQLTANSSTPPEVLAEAGAVRFLSANVSVPDTVAISPQEKATYFLKENSEFFQLGDAGKNLRLEGKSEDGFGNTFVRYSQQYQGVPVFGSGIIVNVNEEDKVDSANASYIPNLEIDIQPMIRSIEAEQTALEDLGTLEGEILEPTSLSIFSPDLSQSKVDLVSHLVWQVLATDGKSVVKTYLIDAQSGDILISIDETLGALKRKVFDVQGASIEDKIGVGLYLLSHGENDLLVRSEENNTPHDDPDVNNSWLYAETVYNYFKNVHNLDSYNGFGSSINMFVNFNCSGNSWWSNVVPTGILLCNDSVSLDLIAHEFTHGFVYANGVLPIGEAAALHEAYGDIFAAMIDDKDPWRITIDAPSEVVFRVLSNPQSKGYPNHYSLYDKNKDPHINSTIFSYAAYLLSDGDWFNGIQVEGIGRDKAQYIYYHVLRYNTTRWPTFIQMRYSVIRACHLLVGKHNITSKNCDQVQNAFAAVGLGKEVKPKDTTVNLLDILKGLALSLQIAARGEIDQWLGDLRQKLEDAIRQGFQQFLDQLLQTILDAINQSFNEFCFGSAAPATVPFVAYYYKRKRNPPKRNQ